MSSKEKHDRREFNNALLRLGFNIKLRPELGDRLAKVFLDTKVGPSNPQEAEPTRDYNGFWNTVYEIAPENFSDSAREFIKNYYLPPETPHLMVGILIDLAKDTENPRLKEALKETMDVYLTYPMKVVRNKE